MPGNTCLNWFAWLGDLEAVKLLVGKGADKNNKGDKGTPLEVAQKRKHEDIVKFLSGEKGNTGTLNYL